MECATSFNTTGVLSEDLPEEAGALSPGLLPQPQRTPISRSAASNMLPVFFMFLLGLPLFTAIHKRHFTIVYAEVKKVLFFLAIKWYTD